MVPGLQESAIATTELPLLSTQPLELIVVGGGASGFMAAITAAEEGLASILVLEASSSPLEKVRISGGGRCNVTHACWDPKDLVFNFPRGRIPLLGPFSRFAPGDVVTWFAERGVELVIEDDGRIFPVKNSSLAIVDCLRRSAQAAGVVLRTKCLVKEVKHLGEKGYVVISREGNSFFTKRVLLATGGHPSGRRIAVKLGHTVVPSVPSLFSFSIEAPALTNCSGISINDVHLKLFVAGKKFQEVGSVLLTHWGLSGPAVLKLSAFAARSLYDSKYNANLIIDWLGCGDIYAKEIFDKYRNIKGRVRLFAGSPFAQLPRRLWLSMLSLAEIDSVTQWANLTSLQEKNLLTVLLESKYTVKGRGPFGEEFVTAGGVQLSEVNLKQMESQICKNLYFTGELLNVDGITGGFNFQHCWSSGWLAGKAIANHSFASN